MAATIEGFFQELVAEGYQPLLGKVQGTIGFDLVGNDGEVDHWLVTVDRGHFMVSQQNSPADCVIQADKALFAQLIKGEENAIAATLRGAIVCTGDVELLFAIQRIFPGPPSKRQAVGAAMESG